ncbi:hypothetical protein [Virgibacillus siamensis]|uniref:hypothetical protein n=1 Tax=Virgibacillus siamensis TaxID=480071 RepID=UPI001FEB572C|nr:hypothetical protein [Virgibacillus siamensis]
MLSFELIIFLGILFVLALGGTALVFRQEEKKMKKYEEEGDGFENELQRSREYETQSIRSNVPRLLWIYIITIALSLTVFFIYVY